MKSLSLMTATLIAGAIALGQSPMQIESQKTVAIARAKQVAIATLMYSQDYDGLFPAAKTQAAFVNATYPYLKTREAYNDANPKKGSILFNFKLAKKKMTSIVNPAKTVMVYSEYAWPDGGRVVGWADGHAKYVSPQAWAEVASQTPAAIKKK